MAGVRHMKMRLYCNGTSPYARKVRVLAQEFGLSSLIEEIDADPFNPSAEFLAANPLSRIPTLVTPQGEALPDSSLIIDFLLTRSEHHHCWPPSDDAHHWALRRRDAVAEGIIDAAVATVLEKRRPESIVYTAFLDRQAATIHRSIEMLNLEVSGLSLDDPGRVEITTGVALAYLDYRLPYLDWRHNHEPLQGWYEAFAQRPSMLNTAPTA